MDPDGPAAFAPHRVAGRLSNLAVARSTNRSRHCGFCRLLHQCATDSGAWEMSHE